MTGFLTRALEGCPIPDRVVSGATQEYMVALRRDPCAYCGGRGGILDHVTPKRRRSEKPGPRAGTDSWPNLTSTCDACNYSKGTKTLLSHLGYRRWCASTRAQLLDDLLEERARWREAGSTP